MAEQVRNLKAKYDVVVITTYGATLSQRKFKPIHQFQGRVHVYSIPYQRFWLTWPARVSQRLFLSATVFLDKLFTSREACNLARRLHERYRFSLVHGHEVLVGDEAARIGRALGIPSVFTLHGLRAYHEILFGRRSVDRAIDNLNATDQLIAVSNLAAQSYKDHHVIRRFEIIPNGVTLQQRISRKAIPPEIADFVRGKLVFLTVGFFVAEKRIEMAIKTLGELHRNGMTNAVLLIVGRGPLEGRIRQTIRQENLGDAVRIVGEVPPKNMPAYYSLTDILIHPSVVDSLSMVCLEAMSHAIPVICTSKIGLVQYVHQGQDAVIVPPDDQVSLYRAALQLVRNPSKRRAIGGKARRTASNLSWNKITPRIERVYEKALQASG